VRGSVTGTPRCCRRRIGRRTGSRSVGPRARQAPPGRQGGRIPARWLARSGSSGRAVRLGDYPSRSRPTSAGTWQSHRRRPGTLYKVHLAIGALPSIFHLVRAGQTKLRSLQHVEPFVQVDVPPQNGVRSLDVRQLRMRLVRHLGQFLVVDVDPWQNSTVSRLNSASPGVCPGAPDHRADPKPHRRMRQLAQEPDHTDPLPSLRRVGIAVPRSRHLGP
jgi:hypothetical protein